MHLEAITSEQKRILDNLKNFPKFYLAEGTALALQIGHRISIDFDLFSPNEIPKSLLDKTRRVFKGSEIKVICNTPEQLSVRINQVKLDFVKYNFPIVLKLIKTASLKIASVPEIAAMKAYSIGHRGTLKDYVDLYFILKEKHITLKEIKKLCEKKYQSEFNFRLFLEQLVYLEDIKTEKIEFLKKPVTKREMVEFFQEEIKKIKI